jgi:hypothetical protein
MLLDVDKVLADEGFVKFLNSLDGVFPRLVGDESNAAIGLIINLEAINRAKMLKSCS